MQSARQVVAFVVVGASLFVCGALSRPMLDRLREHIARSRPTAPNAVYDLDYYQQKAADYAGLGANQPIVFLGDSRIERADWSELFRRGDISNRGISGDTTAGILKRLETSMPNDAQLCVLQVGVNDLQLGVRGDVIIANYEKILRYVMQQRHSCALVTSILLVNADRAVLNGQIAECNRRLAQLAEALGAQWLDLNSSLAPQGHLTGEYTEDGVHLNSKGYLRMRDALAPALPAPAAGLQ